ncbi:MAG: hypothetical protein ACRDVP_07440 [Acidimicrobiales bacterium]
MRYVDAGYVIALCSLFLYGASLLKRRHDLERRGGASFGKDDPQGHR